MLQQEMPGGCQRDHAPLIRKRRCVVLISQNEDPPLLYFSLNLFLHHPSFCQQARLRSWKEKCHVMRPKTKP